MDIAQVYNRTQLSSNPVLLSGTGMICNGRCNLQMNLKGSRDHLILQKYNNTLHIPILEQNTFSRNDWNIEYNGRNPSGNEMVTYFLTDVFLIGPSFHAQNEQRYDMEMQFIYQSVDKLYYVINSILLTSTDSTKYNNKKWFVFFKLLENNMPNNNEKQSKIKLYNTTIQKWSPKSLLPTNKTFINYNYTDTTHYIVFTNEQLIPKSFLTKFINQIASPNYITQLNTPVKSNKTRYNFFIRVDQSAEVPLLDEPEISNDSNNIKCVSNNKYISEGNATKIGKNKNINVYIYDEENNTEQNNELEEDKEKHEKTFNDIMNEYQQNQIEKVNNNHKKTSIWTIIGTIFAIIFIIILISYLYYKWKKKQTKITQANINRVEAVISDPAKTKQKLQTAISQLKTTKQHGGTTNNKIHNIANSLRKLNKLHNTQSNTPSIQTNNTQSNTPSIPTNNTQSNTPSIPTNNTQSNKPPIQIPTNNTQSNTPSIPTNNTQSNKPPIQIPTNNTQSNKPPIHIPTNNAESEPNKPPIHIPTTNAESEPNKPPIHIPTNNAESEPNKPPIHIPTTNAESESNTELETKLELEYKNKLQKVIEIFKNSKLNPIYINLFSDVILAKNEITNIESHITQAMRLTTFIQHIDNTQKLLDIQNKLNNIIIKIHNYEENIIIDALNNFIINS